jgi:putative membrane protein insertion efficiency factor
MTRSSSPPDAAPAGSASSSTSGAAVFHVERLPLQGWDRESSAGGRRAAFVACTARATGGRPTRSATAAPAIHPQPLVHTEHGDPSPGEWRRVLGWPLLLLLWLYRRLVSPVLPPACRYHPSCSQYAVDAVTLHGPVRGVWLSARRLLRCHPWAPGGPDPVPPRQRPDPGRVPR